MPIQITITVDDAGHTSINGPIDNKILTYGILEVAKEAVATYHRKKAENLVQPATIMPPENFDPRGN